MGKSSLLQCAKSNDCVTTKNRKKTLDQPGEGALSGVRGYFLAWVQFPWSLTLESSQAKRSRAAAKPDQIGVSRLVERKRIVLCARSWYASIIRTVRVLARIRIEWVIAV